MTNIGAQGPTQNTAQRLQTEPHHGGRHLSQDTANSSVAGDVAVEEERPQPDREVAIDVGRPLPLFADRSLFGEVKHVHQPTLVGACRVRPHSPAPIVKVGLDQRAEIVPWNRPPPLPSTPRPWDERAILQLRQKTTQFVAGSDRIQSERYPELLAVAPTAGQIATIAPPDLYLFATLGCELVLTVERGNGHLAVWQPTVRSGIASWRRKSDRVVGVLWSRAHLDFSWPPVTSEYACRTVGVSPTSGQLAVVGSVWESLSYFNGHCPKPSASRLRLSPHALMLTAKDSPRMSKRRRQYDEAQAFTTSTSHTRCRFRSAAKRRSAMGDFV
ncbi:MAG TPA: hypothetical protein VM165_07725 [Planctomycetaceae bacterium]|nr:hypothetical protein [Planctomycetaceae bacterium]